MPTIAPPKPVPLLLPVTMPAADAAALLAVTPRTIHRWIAGNRLEGARVGDRVIVTGRSVAAILTASGLPAAVTS